MDNLIFSMQATMPIFLLMLLGYLLRKWGIISETFASEMNHFVFWVPLPVLVFEDLANVEFDKIWSGNFIGFCFFATVVSIGLSTLLAFLWKDKSVRGEFAQASYRSSAALIGIVFIQNAYGEVTLAPLMLLSCVPLYNMLSVIILAFLKPDGERITKKMLCNTAKKVATNPIVLGLVAGILWSFIGIPMPVVLQKTLSKVAAMASPMGLIAMGASFEMGKAIRRVKPALAATFMKLVGFPIIFLAMAIPMGFRGEELLSILVMVGSATTVSSFVMAKNMGHEGALTSSVIMLSTFFSAITLTGWLFILKSLGLV